MKNRRIILALMLVFTFVVPCGMFAGTETMSPSAAEANRRTALRCLSQATYNLSLKNWTGAANQATLGIYYDDSISDLYYILAVALNSQNCKKAEVIPLVQQSLELDSWVDYNRDGARILYADLLCDTGRYSQVPEILNSSPMIYTADAEYIRAKAYYRMGTTEDKIRAREKIDSARKIYPSDTRFPLLFFKNENPQDQDSEVRRIASAFISRISQYAEAAPDKDAELEIYAASFATGMDQEHMLKSFAARNLIHPLYAETALCAGLITEANAFEYFAQFFQEGVSYALTERLVSLLTQQNVIDVASRYFTSFDGIFLFDTDQDGIDNMYVKYYRGRPETIAYDRMQDGTFDWTIVCDFGEPVSGTLASTRMEYRWNNFPYLSSVVYRDENGKDLYKYTLVEETLKWSPVRVEKNEIFSQICGFDFFVPVVNELPEYITDQQLLAAASCVETNSMERRNAQISFLMLDSHVLSARYSVNGIMYAQAQFENDLPVLRIVDSDGDGIFERTEFYAVDSDSSMEVHSFTEEQTIMTNIFGVPSNGGQFYLRMVQIDGNGDTVPDFTEEYLARNGKISSWDTDGDGLWNIRYVRYPDTDTGDGTATIVEDSMFYDGTGTELVTITSINGFPVEVSGNDQVLEVQKDSVYDFYWIGPSGTSRLARKCLDSLARKNGQGYSLIVEDNEARVQCIKIGTTSYGKIVPYTDFSE